MVFGFFLFVCEDDIWQCIKLIVKEIYGGLNQPQEYDFF